MVFSAAFLRIAEKKGEGITQMFPTIIDELNKLQTFIQWNGILCGH